MGVSKEQLRDPEGLTRVDLNGETFLIAASSLCVASTNRSGQVQVNDGLVRVRYTPEGDLHAEAMSGFRAWLLSHEASLAEPGGLEPDAGGLNIEGLAWDPGASALLFGQRGPANPGRITIIRIPVDAGAGRWTTSALNTPSILLVRTPQSTAKYGIRDISYDEQTGDFLILLGRPLSRGDAPFQLCAWNGSSDDVRLIDVTFHRSMKPEGITTFSSGGKRQILIVDDAGGFAVLKSRDGMTLISRSTPLTRRVPDGSVPCPRWREVRPNTLHAHLRPDARQLEIAGKGELVSATSTGTIVNSSAWSVLFGGQV